MLELEGRSTVGVQDVHRANIVAMRLSKDETQIFTLCSRGILAQWSTESGELITLTQLDYSKSKAALACIDHSKIVAYLAEKR